MALSFDRVSIMCDKDFVFQLQQKKHFIDVNFNSVDAFIHYFQRRMKGYYHDVFIIKKDDSQIGLVLAYDYRFYDAHCKIDVLVDDVVTNETYSKMINEVIEYLFILYPLRCIFSLQYDKNIIECFSKAGFIEEGILKEYKYVDGKYVNVHILMIGKMECIENVVL